MRRLVVPAVLVVVLAAAAAAVGLGTSHETARAKGLAALSPVQQRLVSGFARQVLQARSGFAPQARPQARPSQQRSTQITGCPVDRGSNVRVNQDCLNLRPTPTSRAAARRRTRPPIAQDPNDPAHLVASSNDYRRGDGNCYAYYSTDGGTSWDDSTVADELHARHRVRRLRPPVLAGRRRHLGRVGHQGQRVPVVPDVQPRRRRRRANPDQSSAFYVFRSTGTDGASWNFPARPVAELNDTAGSGDALLDKQYMTIDDQKGSPFQDRHLRDLDAVRRRRHRLHLRGVLARLRRELLDAAARQRDEPAVLEHARRRRRRRARCNENQFSQPFTGPDGALYVVFDNYNVTGVRPGEGDGGDGGDAAQPAPAPASTTARRCCSPSRPTAATRSRRRSRSPTTTTCPTARPTRAQDEGVACVPEKGETQNSNFRAANYPAGAVNPTNPSEVDVTFALLHQPPLQRAQRMRAAGLQPRHRSSRSTTASRRRARATTTSCSAARRTAARRSRADDQRPRAAVRARQRSRRATSSGSGRRSTTRQPRGLLLRPRLRQRRADRVLRHQPVGQRQRPRLRDQAGDDRSMPPRDAVRGRVLRRLQRAERRRRGPPDLDGHARSGPVRVPRLGGQRHPAAEPLHGARRRTPSRANDQNIYTRILGIPTP